MNWCKPLGIAVITLCLVAFAVAAETPRPDDFGHQWVRNHPFTTMALTLDPRTLQDDKYAQCNLNSLLVWKRKDGLFESAVRQQLPWHCHLVHKIGGKKSIPSGVLEKFAKLEKKYPGCEGVLVWDEPEDMSHIRQIAEGVAWVKKNYPDKLVYTNVGRQGPRPFDTCVDIVKPDIFLCSAYPFRSQAKPKHVSTYTFLQEVHFSQLAEVRGTGLRTNIPYWSFVQAFGEPGRPGWRVPSESELRMQVYSTLAMGFTGIIYFTWDHDTGGLINRQKGKPAEGEVTHLYHDAQKINAEIAHLGKALRYLKSVDVRYVARSYVEDGKMRTGATPDGLLPFRAYSRRLREVRDIVVQSGPAEKGADVMLGVLADDNGDRYLMLVNMWCTPDGSAQDCQMAIQVKLGSKVKKLARLSRTTGKVETVQVKDGMIEMTLPGGTGELFKINDSDFPGLDK